MYQIDWTRLTPAALLARRRGAPVSRNVWYLGFTSLFTDISSEMVASVLPAYLVLYRGLSPLEFGAIDGLYQGASTVVRWLGGFAGDRRRRYKEVAAAGYAVSAVSKLGLLMVGGRLPMIAGVIALDRSGKGFRAAPRDALISLTNPPESIGAAFGVHRALDAAGALLGPLAAFAVLRFMSGAFDSVFVVSFSVALVGLAVLLLFVENPADDQVRLKPPFDDAQGGPEALEGPDATGSAASPDAQRATSVLVRDRRFRNTVLAVCALSLATVSDGFVYLALQRGLRFGAAMFPLLAVMTAASYVLIAIPAGRLADRVGRRRVFVVGHVMLLSVYALLLLGRSGVPVAMTCVLALGIYYAMTDGVLAAGASAILPPAHRGKGLALVGMAVSGSRAIGALAFGWIWNTWDISTALACFSVTLLVVLPFASRSLASLDLQVA